MRARLLPALLWVLVSGFGCTPAPEASGSASNTEPAAEPSTATTGPAAQPEPREGARLSANAGAKLPPPKLPSERLEPAREGYELLTAGDSPRALLRFGPTPGQVETIKLTMTMHMEISGPGVPPMVQNLPPLEQINRAQTTAVREGRIDEQIVFQSFAVDGAGANAQLATMMLATMEQIRGFEQSIVYDDRGAVIEGELSIPADANPQLAKSLGALARTFEQIMVHFPEPELGVGATWRETGPLEHDGISLEQTSQFELVAREGDLLTLDMQITQRPLSDKFTPKDNPAGEVSLLEFDARGGGRVIYDLAKMMPSLARSEITTAFTIETTIAGQARQLTSNIQIALQLERLD